jgi:hypothetical protein
MPFEGEKFEETPTPPEEEKEEEVEEKPEEAKEVTETEEKKFMSKEDIITTRLEEIDWEKVPDYKDWEKVPDEKIVKELREELRTWITEKELEKLKMHSSLAGETGEFLVEKKEELKERWDKNMQRWNDLEEAKLELQAKHGVKSLEEVPLPPVLKEIMKEEYERLEQEEKQLRKEELVLHVKLKEMKDRGLAY